MRTLVAYYSRDGATRTVAERLAQQLSDDLEQIDCLKSYDGFLGYFRAGRDSWRGKLPPIAPPRQPLGAYDLVIICAPLWAGHAATPARTYLQQHSGMFKRLALLITHGGSSPDAAFQEMEELAGAESQVNLAIRAQAIAKNEFEMDLATFSERLHSKMAA